MQSITTIAMSVQKLVENVRKPVSKQFNYLQVILSQCTNHLSYLVMERLIAVSINARWEYACGNYPEVNLVLVSFYPRSQKSIFCNENQKETKATPN